MPTLGIIPARAGSKRLPQKNLLPLGGKPLVCWALEAALQAKKLDALVVSSDSSAILEIANRYGPSLGLLRPEELAQDRSLAIEYVRHALGALEPRLGVRFSQTVIVQPTTPLLLADDIDHTVDLLERTHADSAVSVTKIDQLVHPLKLKILQGDRLLPYLEDERGRMDAHQIPEIYVRNGAVYASRREVIDKGEVIGPDCRAIVMPRERSVDINDPIDFEFVQFLLQRRGRSVAA